MALSKILQDPNSIQSIDPVDTVALDAPPDVSPQGFRVLVADPTTGVSSNPSAGVFVGNGGKIAIADGANGWTYEDTNLYPKDQMVGVRDSNSIWIYWKQDNKFYDTGSSATAASAPPVNGWIDLLNKFGANYTRPGLLAGDQFIDAITALRPYTRTMRDPGDVPYVGLINTYPATAKLSDIRLDRGKNFWDEFVIVNPDDIAWVQFGYEQPILLTHDAANPGSWKFSPTNTIFQKVVTLSDAQVTAKQIVIAGNIPSSIADVIVNWLEGGVVTEGVGVSITTTTNDTVIRWAGEYFDGVAKAGYRLAVQFAI